MAKRGNPYPWVTNQLRPLYPFDKTIKVRLNGSLQESDLTKVWQSGALRTNGLTLAEGFVTLAIIQDSAPGSPFALVGRLGQMCGAGSDGNSGPQDSIAFGIPGFPGKQYVGPGTYNFRQLQSGGIQTNVGLGTAVRFELFALGRPAGRILRCRVTGTLVAGWTYG